MYASDDYIQIDLIKAAEGLIRRSWIIILSMILCGALLFSYAAFFATPLYESSVLIYVNNSSSSKGTTNASISSSEISAAKSLVDTYLVILKTRSTLNDVIQLCELDYTYEQLSEMITAAAVNDTEIFSVAVTSPDPCEAEQIANAIASVLPDKIAEIVEGSSVRIIDHAVVPTAQVSPSPLKCALIGLLLGFLLSCAVVAVIEIADDRICSKKDLLDNFSSIPLLSVIPDVQGAIGRVHDDAQPSEGKRATAMPSFQSEQALFGQNLSFAATEAYKLLRTNLLFSLPEAQEGKGRIIGVSSSLRNEGRSTTVIHLAGALAEQGKRVLVAECDLRIPSIHRKLNIRSQPGLSSILAAQESVDEYIQQVGVGNPNARRITFDVLVAGEVPATPSELIGSEHMKRHLEQLAARYDFILLDLPPVTTVPDALVAAKLLEGIVMVVRNKYTDSRSLKEAIRQLRLVNGKILGFVLNGVNNTPGGYRCRKYDR